MNKKQIFWILKVFLIWRLFLEVIINLAPKFLRLQSDFVGIIPWANYDAQHYIQIARYGYNSLQYFYFPLYPMLISIFSDYLSISSNLLLNNALAGLLISHVSLFVCLIGLYKLIKLKFSEKISKLSIILLLTFPTSYYFVSVYTESLFLMLVVWSFLFFEKKKYLYAGNLGAFAAATRTTGIVLLPAFLLQYLSSRSPSRDLVNKFCIFLIPLGLIIYMYYLHELTGSAFAFNENGFIFGEYRSPDPVLLPQVLYRYIFKILPAVSISNYFPAIFTTYLEFLSAIGVIVSLIFGIKKIPISWWIYMLGGFLSPTLYLNFVSMPRYVIVLFPFFIILATLLENKKIYKYLYITFSCIGLIIALSLFSRGYWVS